MNVVDASVVLDLVVGAVDPERLGHDVLAAPHLLDSEVLQGIRRLTLHGALTEAQGRIALETFEALEIRRFPATAHRQRIWELRHAVSAYDATYIALAEAVEASLLLTTDARLGRAHGVRCDVRVL